LKILILLFVLVVCPTLVCSSSLPLKVDVSAYWPSPECGEGDWTVGAMGTEIRPGKTCAVSRDLRHLLGTEIYIEGVGWRFVNDLMHKRWTKKIDLCVKSKKRAYEWGVRKKTITQVF